MLNDAGKGIVVFSFVYVVLVMVATVIRITQLIIQKKRRGEEMLSKSNSREALQGNFVILGKREDVQCNDSLLYNANNDTIIERSEVSLEVTVYGSETGNVVTKTFDKSSITIGRSGCDVTICDRRVSRLHAKIIVKDSKLYIEDMNSSNHTFVDSRMLDGENTEINEDSVIRICDAIIRIKIIRI